MYIYACMYVYVYVHTHMKHNTNAQYYVYKHVCMWGSLDPAAKMLYVFVVYVCACTYIMFIHMHQLVCMHVRLYVYV